jgi:hypothetical protein
LPVKSEKEVNGYHFDGDDCGSDDEENDDGAGSSMSAEGSSMSAAGSSMSAEGSSMSAAGSSMSAEGSSMSADVSDGSSNEGELNLEEIETRWRADRYAVDTQARFQEKYRTMVEWIQQRATQFWPISLPFPEALCIQYVHHEMRRKKNGNLLGPGHLYQVTQMLYYEGFLKHGHTVPTSLTTSLRNALQAHKRNLAKRIARGNQGQADSHAQNASWTAVEFCAKKLHDKRPGTGYDSRAALYFLTSVQSLSRGERIGKMLYSVFGKGVGGDHISAGKGMTSKSDQTGKRSYNKRFVPNYKKTHMCVVTALGRHLLSLDPDHVSKYVFMSKKEAKHFERLQRLRLKRQRCSYGHSKPPKRSRAIGPHKKFDRLIQKVFELLPVEDLLSMGLSTTKKFVGHCKKKAGFAQAVEVNGIDAQMVHTRAEHCTGNYNTYASRSIIGVPNSGGPPARQDISMAKALAGLQQYTAEFNEVPPHWDETVIAQIPFAEIVPCYNQLPSGMKSVVPLALAQVVYHYHRSSKGLSVRHPMFRTPLWTTHQALRDDLFDALRGADTNQPSVLKPLYSDKLTEQYLWTEQINQASTLMLKNAHHVIQIATEANRIAKDNEIKLNKILDILGSISQDNVISIQCSNPPMESSKNPPMETIISQDNVISIQCSNPPMESSKNPPMETIQAHTAESTDASNFDDVQNDTGGFAKHFNSSQTPLSIETIDVEAAWHAWHGSGNELPWRTVSKSSHCLPCSSDKRREALSSLSKIRQLVAFIQGKTSDGEIDRDVSKAWNVCKHSTKIFLK